MIMMKNVRHNNIKQHGNGNITVMMIIITSIKIIAPTK